MQCSVVQYSADTLFYIFCCKKSDVHFYSMKNFKATEKENEVFKKKRKIKSSMISLTFSVYALIEAEVSDSSPAFYGIE